MGHTNLPQPGAAHQKNSRDTRSGVQQLDAEERREKSETPAPAVVPPDPAITPAQAIIGHVDTGHSPPDAT
ncbi:hypothetical protein [Rhodanobacter ginsengiterrae]|uniref:hypothetical protein n=1 Tax=Rhodanobacter ginsengiterrae TaxID=2008451 RepID=UPI003CF03FDA